jgi:hypothetical protein
MGRYRKDIPEEVKQESIALNRWGRNFRYRLKHGYYNPIKQYEKESKKEKTREERLERRKPKDEAYRIQHRHYYKTKSKQYRRSMQNIYGKQRHYLEKFSFDRLVYTAHKLGFPLSEDFLKVATKKDLIEIIQNYQISKKRIEKEKEEKEKEKSKPKTAEEEYRDWQYWLIPIIFFGSLMLGILAVRYGVNLFSLFGQVF